MYLKELTVNGFKSFAKKSDFEFSAAITAIVGPNGSGKSNVAESFRFVLGEQSVKSMRGKKGEDLIWGGSEKVSRGNRASAEVVFDNTARNFSLDFDEIKIERVVHRDGQNEYKINGSQVRLKDVHELLANANIGSTGHHIISQGEADRVLSAGAKERREMIEDALGLKVYQLKKQEADRKLEKTNDNIVQVESLRRESAPHLKYLKKQVERAERSIQVQEELKTAYVEYLRREDTYIAKNLDALTAAKRQPEQVLHDLEGKIKDAKRVADNESDTTESDVLIAARQTLSQATTEWQQAQTALSHIEGQVSFLSRRIEEANKPEKKPQKLISQQAIKNLIYSVVESAEKALVAGGEDSLKKVLTTLVSQLKSFVETEAEEVVNFTLADTSELDALVKQVSEAQKKVQHLREERDKADAAVRQHQNIQLAGLQKQRTAEKELFVLLQEQRDLQSELRTIDAELSVLERDRADFKQELQEAVALIGRGVMEYFSMQIQTSEGVLVSDNEIAAEERSRQRERARNLEKLKIRLEELGAGDTKDLLKEYKDAKERDEFLEKELADLAASVENLHTLITEMQAKLEEQFVEGVEKITIEFDKFFKLMFGGGAAKLDRVTIKKRGSDDGEEDSVAEDGVELNVSLPNKRVRGLDMLSGGERALTSIALIFAMSQVNPPPFIILDETDAALDEANSRRYGDMIEALSKRSQLVLITHNRETMSRAGILYGITMGSDGVSKVLSVKFDEAAINAK